MGNKIYVGNLSYDTSEESLSGLFAQYGTVSSCKIIMDKMTGRGKGFGFVEMSTPDEAQKAITELDGTTLDSRALRVNEAKPQERRPNNGGGNRW